MKGAAAWTTLRRMVLPQHVPADLVVDFDVYAPALPGEGFHAAWVRFQRSTPERLVWSPRHGGHWIVVRGRDVADVYADHARFSSSVNSIPPPRGRAPLGAIGLDPPEHGPFRAFLNTGLSLRIVRDLEAGVRSLAVDLIEGFRRNGRCDFIHEFADVLPLTIFLRLVDVPLQDRLRLARWAAQVTRDTSAEVRHVATLALGDYLRPLIAARAEAPGEDLLSRIVHADVGGRKPTEAEALGACTHLMIAGLDTVSSLLGFVMHFLATNPGHRRVLIDEPARIQSAVKELIRRFPLVVMSREVREDTELCGVRLRKGDMVTLPTMLFNLDAELYPDPLAVDWDRPVLATCTFGHGAHRCPGAPLGQREVAITIEAWLSRIPDFEVDDGQPFAVKGGVVATLDKLPLRWPT